MRRLIAGLCAIAGMLYAQAPHSTWEVFGAVGIGKTYDDEGSLGSGLNGGGGVGYRLSHRFGVEAEVNAFRTRREFSAPFPPFRASGVHVMGSGLLYLNRGRTQAYLIGGAGLLHIRPEANGFAVNFGAGLKIFAGEHFSIRPEFRVYAGDSGHTIEPPFGDLRLSIGAGYHW